MRAVRGLRALRQGTSEVRMSVPRARWVVVTRWAMSWGWGGCLYYVLSWVNLLEDAAGITAILGKGNAPWLSALLAICATNDGSYLLLLRTLGGIHSLD